MLGNEIRPVTRATNITCNKSSKFTILLISMLGSIHTVHVHHSGHRRALNKTIAEQMYMQFIGASLSEPHTSVSSLRVCVCMLAWTDHIPEILNMRFHLHVQNSTSNSNSKRSMESSSSCSSTPMGLPSVSTTMELLSSKERLRLEREGRATAWLRARVCSYSHALIQYSRIYDAHRTRRNRLQQHSL